jgi:hypothetical protein
MPIVVIAVVINFMMIGVMAVFITHRVVIMMSIPYLYFARG